MPTPRHGRRRRFDDDDWSPHSVQIRPTTTEPDWPPLADPIEDDTDLPPGVTESTYVDATHGPAPCPDWVVTDPRAIDIDRGVLKSGKEADVALVERRLEADGEVRLCLLAAKRYRDREHRMFHRDAAYLEGRRVRRSREMRAMTTRTAYGLELIAGQWASAEFAVLSRLWTAGAAVPYPVQLLGTEVMMELVGDPDGTAAPRLAQLRPGRAEALELYAQLRHSLLVLAEAGLTHGDLSPYNLLVHRGRLVLIDLPQAVDLVGNPQGLAFLRRDCANVCTWFAAHGVPEADDEELANDLLRCIPGFPGWTG